MAHVLIVEDDSDIALVMRLAAEPVHVVDIADSLEAARARWARPPRPDLVVLDLGLPDGSGVDFCEEVKRDAPEVPVIIVSAYPDLIAQAASCGAELVMAKPFDPDELLARIDQVLEGCAARRPASPA